MFPCWLKGGLRDSLRKATIAVEAADHAACICVAISPLMMVDFFEMFDVSDAGKIMGATGIITMVSSVIRVVLFNRIQIESTSTLIVIG